jgi:hypothetical protein
MLTYLLRIASWAFNNLVIYPVAASTLIFARLFWLDNTTPGTEIVRAVNSAKIENSPGEFLIARCQTNSGEELMRVISDPQICEKQNIKVNAYQYASYLDSKLWGLFKALWMTMALVYVIVALYLRTFPSYRSYTPAIYAYGIRPKKSSERKEGD